MITPPPSTSSDDTTTDVLDNINGSNEEKKMVSTSLVQMNNSNPKKEIGPNDELSEEQIEPSDDDETIQPQSETRVQEEIISIEALRDYHIDRRIDSRV